MTRTATAPLLADDARPGSADPGVKDVRLVPAQDTASDLAPMFERLARDPNTSVEKIERLMALWERNEAKKAEAAFNAGMSAAQKDIRPVVADEYNSQTQSKYASYEALDAEVRPIYTKHGFGLSFDTGFDAPPEHVRVLCYCTHSGGHKHTYHIDMPADGKGPKGGDVMTRTHATGSGTSYGQRYLLKLIFNIPIKDDDGNKAGGKPKGPDAPEGYDAWFSALDGVAAEGMVSFSKAWNASKEEYRRHLSATAPTVLAKLKTTAAKVKP